MSKKKEPAAALPESDLQVPLDLEVAREYLAAVLAAEERLKEAKDRLQTLKYEMAAALRAVAHQQDLVILARASAHRAILRATLPSRTSDPA